MAPSRIILTVGLLYIGVVFLVLTDVVPRWRGGFETVWMRSGTNHAAARRNRRFFRALGLALNGIALLNSVADLAPMLGVHWK